MTNERSEEYRIESDKNVRESGVQGGKIIGEHLALGCFIVGVPFFIIGLYGLISMSFGFGFPMNTALLIGVVLVTVIGGLFLFGGYTIYRTKHEKK